MCHVSVAETIIKMMIMTITMIIVIIIIIMSAFVQRCSPPVHS